MLRAFSNLFVLLAFCFLCACSSNVDSPGNSAPQDNNNNNNIDLESLPLIEYGRPSQMEGYAPLAVFFEGMGTSSWDDISETRYRWEFGDGEVGAGFMSQHIFRTPGTYTVNLVIGRGGEWVGRQSWEITVREFDQRNCYVSSSTGSDSNPTFDGSAPEKAFQSINYAVTRCNDANVRFLLRRGDTFNTGTIFLSGRSGQTIVTDFGDSAAAKPLITSGGFYVTANTGGFTAQNLTMLGTYVVGGSVPDLNAFSFVDQKNVLLDNLGISNFGKGLYSGAGFEAGVINNVEFRDNGDYHYYATGVKRIAINQCQFLGQARNHATRMQGGDRILYSKNHFDHYGNFNTGITLRGDLEFALLQDNDFKNEVAPKPQNNDEEEYVSKVLIERNLFSSQVGRPLYWSIEIQAQDVLVRNNIFDGVTHGLALSEHPLVGIPARIKILNNTSINSGPFLTITAGASIVIFNNIATSNTTLSSAYPYSLGSVPLSSFNIDHNLWWFPGVSAAGFTTYYNGAGYARDAWRSFSGFDSHALYSDPQWVNPAAADYALAAGSSAQGQGVARADVFEDYLGNSRNATGANDMGAVESP